MKAYTITKAGHNYIVETEPTENRFFSMVRVYEIKDEKPYFIGKAQATRIDTAINEIIENTLKSL